MRHVLLCSADSWRNGRFPVWKVLILIRAHLCHQSRAAAGFYCSWNQDRQRGNCRKPERLDLESLHVLSTVTQLLSRSQVQVVRLLLGRRAIISNEPVQLLVVLCKISS